MRNIYLRLFAALVLLPVFGGCSDFTDITPKGQSILNKVEELELLLNDEYMQLQAGSRCICSMITFHRKM